MLKKNSELCVITYKTESGDDGLVGVYNRKPTAGQLASIARELFPEEVDEETKLATVRFDLHELYSDDDIRILPEPSEPLLVFL